MMPRTEIDHLVAEDSPDGAVSLFDGNLGGEVVIPPATIDRLIDFLADRLPTRDSDPEPDDSFISDLATYGQREGVTVNTTRPAAALGAPLIDAATGMPADIAELQRRRDEAAAAQAAAAATAPFPLGPGMTDPAAAADVPPFLASRLTNVIDLGTGRPPEDEPTEPAAPVTGPAEPAPTDYLRDAMEQAAQILLVAAAHHRGASVAPSYPEKVAR